MYTEEDLRATLGALEREAPDAAGVLARLARARRRRTARQRAVGVVAVAAVAAAVAGGSVLVGNLANSPDEDTATQTASLRYPFAVDESSGLRLSYWAAGSDEAASAWIGGAVPGADGKYQYLLKVFEAGGYEPPADDAGEPVQVNGMTGVYREDFEFGLSYAVYPERPGVAWEYAPDSWAVLRYLPIAQGSPPQPDDVRGILLHIAEAVRFDRAAPVRLPFQIGYLPAGLHPAENFPADMNVGPSDATVLVALEGKTRFLCFWLTEGLHGSDAPDDLDAEEFADGVLGAKINLGRFAVQVTGKGFSEEELKTVARSISPAADLHDEDTWFDGGKALQLH